MGEVAGRVHPFERRGNEGFTERRLSHWVGRTYGEAAGVKIDCWIQQHR